MTRVVHVAVAVIRNREDQIIIAFRDESRHQGGLWEFPGGKVEAGESVTEALAREIDEEIGLNVLSSTPLIQIYHDYGDKAVLLDVHEVTEFAGQAEGKEGQPVRWVPSAQLTNYQFPAANQPIITATQLPRQLAITPVLNTVAEYQALFEKAELRSIRAILLRAPLLNDTEYAELYTAISQMCRKQNTLLIAHCRLELANDLQAEALHLTSQQLQAVSSREQFAGRWLSASCHSEAELTVAQQLNLDFVTLSPVLPTQSHPDQAELGWSEFAALVKTAHLPVFALGGVAPAMLPIAIEQGAQGVAGIRAFWRDLGE